MCPLWVVDTLVDSPFSRREARDEGDRNSPGVGNRLNSLMEDGSTNSERLDWYHLLRKGCGRSDGRDALPQPPQAAECVRRTMESRLDVIVDMDSAERLA